MKQQFVEFAENFRNFCLRLEDISNATGIDFSETFITNFIDKTGEFLLSVGNLELIKQDSLHLDYFYEALWDNLYSSGEPDWNSFYDELKEGKAPEIYIERFSPMAVKQVAMIAQPMRGLSETEIIRIRDQAAQKLREAGYQVINTYFEESDIDESEVNIPVYLLGRTIEEGLSQCDTIYFCKGWQKARGCRIEYAVAKSYGIKTLFEDPSEETLEAKNFKKEYTTIFHI